VGEGVERLALLVDDLAVLVRDLLGGKAIDLAQDELHVRLPGVVAILEVGAQEALVAVLRGAGVELLQALGQAAEELRVGGHVAGRRAPPSRATG
jgi:hypothetical protein